MDTGNKSSTGGLDGPEDDKLEMTNPAPVNDS